MRLMSSTWRTIVSVHWSNTSRSVVMTLPYLRRMRSAESWIGVSGFLISCAMRRATSAQAEVRCAETRSVMSSRVMTKPLSSPRACSLVTRTLRVRSRPLREIRICCWTRRCRVDFASSIRGAISGSTASTGWPIRSDRAEPSSASADGLTMVIWPRGSMPITPAETPERTASVKRRRRSMRSLAAVRSSCWWRSSDVILLKVSPRWAEVAVLTPHRHLDIEVAGRHLVRGVDEPPDRRDQAVREIEAEPHRRQQHDQGHEREHGREGDLDAELLLLEHLVIGDARFRRRDELGGARIDGTGDEQDAPVMGRELEDRAEHVAGTRDQAQRVLLAGLAQILLARRRHVLERTALDPLRHRPVRLDQHGQREAEEGGARGHELAKQVAVGVEQPARPVEIRRHQIGLAGERPALRVPVGRGDLDRVRHDRLDRAGEPGVEAAIERDGGDQRDEHRRKRRHEAEQADDARVQARPGGAGAAGAHEAARLPGDDADQDDDEHQIEEEQRPHDVVGRQDGRHAAEHEERRQRRTGGPPSRSACRSSRVRAGPRRRVSCYGRVAVRARSKKAPRLGLSHPKSPR